MKFLSGLSLGLLVAVAAYVYASVTAGRTVTAPPAEWTAGSAAGAAWRQLLVSLEAGGAEVFAATDDPAARAEGLAYLAQLASAALEMKLARGDQAMPELTDWMSGYRKFLGDSPDAIYHTAEISADYIYELTGNAGDAMYMGFTLYGRSLNGWNRVAANITKDQMTLSAAGDFTLRMGRARPAGYPGDWLSLPDDAHLIMIRQYFHDRDGASPAQVSIRALDPPARAVGDDQQVAAGLEAATVFFNETLAGNLALMEMLMKAPNSFDPPREYSPDFGGVFYPTTDNAYYGTWFSLAPGQAILVEGVAPEASYWSASVQNRWLQSLDDRHHRVSLNNNDIEVDGDGRYRLVVSPVDPGTGNWLGTGGSTEGLLAIRYQMAGTAKPPGMRVVSLVELQSPGDQGQPSENREREGLR